MQNPSRCILFALALLAAALPAAARPASPAEAPALAGHWRGAIEIPGAALEIDVDLAEGPDGALSGDISIPAQGAKDLPLADLAAEGAQISFRLPGVPGEPRFAGEVAEGGDAISGTFTQGPASFPFALARAGAPADVARERLAGLDETIAQALADFRAPGLAIAVVRGGEVVYARGFGVRDLERELPVTADTLFAIGSTTKAMTATVLGTLVDEGKVAWDEPVRTYLPWFRLSDPVLSERLTVRDLLTHRSGLPRHDLVWYNDNESSRRELVARLAHLDRTADLREKFQYNNLMYLTAGYLAGEVAGTSWEELVRERLLRPLGMERTTFSIRDSERDPDHAVPYDVKEGGRVVRIPFRPLDVIGPAGAVNSSAHEMARWLLLNLGGGQVGGHRLVQAATLAAIHTPQMTTGAPPSRREVVPVGYGLGWGIDVYRGHRRVQHGGGIDGFITMVTLLPDDDLGIVSFVNAGVGLPGLVNNVVIDRVLGLEPIDWLGEALAERKTAEAAGKEAKEKQAGTRIAGTKPSHPLADYAGEYGHPGYGALRVEVADAKKATFALTFNGIRAPLEHWHYDVWNGAETDGDETFEGQKLLFRGSVDGGIAAVETRPDPLAPPVVFTRQPPARLSDPAVLAGLAGRYQFPDEAAEVTLAGGVLRLTVPGQPTYTLEPEASGRFRLKEVPAIAIEFVEEGGRAVRLLSHQPNGVFEAKRIE